MYIMPMMIDIRLSGEWMEGIDLIEDFRNNSTIFVLMEPSVCLSGKSDADTALRCRVCYCIGDWLMKRPHGTKKVLRIHTV